MPCPPISRNRVSRPTPKNSSVYSKTTTPPSPRAATRPPETAKAALRAKFIEWEIQADFVEDLGADYKALNGANKRNQAGTQEGVENTEAISQILLAAGKDVDAVMNNKSNRQPEKLRAWLTASRVHRSPQRAKEPAPAAGGGTGGFMPSPKPTP